MHYKTITDFSEITEQSWDSLLAKSRIRSPFLLYGYQHTWWTHLGGGEWQNASLNIVTAHNDGELVGIAPLFRVENNGKTEIHFIGSFEISDYLDFIVLPDLSEDFIHGVLNHLKSDETDFDRLVLFNIADDSPTISALNTRNVENAYHTPVITLADNWDDYLAGIDKKQRHEIRRKIRRAENAEDDTVAWHIVNPDEGIDTAISEFTRLMANDPEKEKFLTGQMRAQMEAIIRWAANQGILQLSFLTINGENAAAYLCFDHADRIWVYNSGFSPNFRYYSPGWVLLSYLIQNAITKKRTHFDFMRGDEKYKYRFGASDSFVMKAIIQQKNS